MPFGPVLTFELITTARRGRYYAARVAYGLVLLFTFWTEYHYMVQWQRGFVSIKEMSLFAESAFIAFATGQGLMLLALIPAMVAGVVADEHQRKTLHYLLASQLTGAEIVLGKLGARLIHAGVFVLMGLPIVCLIGMYGGLDPWKVLYVYAGTFSIALFLAGMSMLVSVVARRPRDAILMAYGLEAAWLFLLPIFDHLAQFFAWPIAFWLAPLTGWAMATHPAAAWGRLSSQAQMQVQFANMSNAPWLTSMAAEVHLAFLWMIGLQALLGCLFLILAVALLRPLRGGARGRRRRGWLARRREREAVGRPGCGDDPMIWKERYAGRGGGLAWLTSLPVVLVLGTLLGCYLFDAAWPAFGELISWRGGGSARSALNAELRIAGAALFSLWLVAVSSAAAVGVTSEREEDTWTSLTATLLTGPEIVRAKMFGAAWGARRMGVALLAVWGVGLLSGAVHPLGFLTALAGLGIYTWFATALGLWMSLKAKNSTRAMIGTILLMVFLNGGYIPLVLTLIGPQPPGVIAAGVSPSIEWIALLSYRDVRALWSGGVFFEHGKGPHGPEVLAMVFASFSLYALGAFGLTRAAVGAFDTAVGRPRLGAKGIDGKGGVSPPRSMADEARFQPIDAL